MDEEHTRETTIIVLQCFILIQTSNTVTTGFDMTREAGGINLTK